MDWDDMDTLGPMTRLTAVPKALTLGDAMRRPNSSWAEADSKSHEVRLAALEARVAELEKKALRPTDAEVLASFGRMQGA